MLLLFGVWIQVKFKACLFRPSKKLQPQKETSGNSTYATTVSFKTFTSHTKITKQLQASNGPCKEHCKRTDYHSFTKAAAAPYRQGLHLYSAYSSMRCDYFNFARTLADPQATTSTSRGYVRQSTGDYFDNPIGHPISWP